MKMRNPMPGKFSENAPPFFNNQAVYTDETNLI